MLKRLTLGKKIGLGFSMLIVLLLVVGGIAYRSLDAASNGFNQYRHSARTTNHVGPFQADLLMMRFDAKDFIISGSEESRKSVEERGKRLKGFITQAQQNTKVTEYSETDAKIIGLLDQFQTGFAQLVTLQDRKDGLVLETLDVTGPAMEQALTDIMASAEKDNDMMGAYYSGIALRHLLLGRLYANRFFDSNDKTALNRVHQEFEKMSEMLTILDRELQNSERRDKLNIILVAKKQYSGAFDEVAQIVFSQRNLQETIDRMGSEVTQVIDKMKDWLIRQQDTLGPRLVASNDKAVRVIVIVIALATIIGVIIAFIITRMITRPLKTVVALSKRAGSGDLTFTREAFNHDANDELGQMADALAAMIAAQRNAIRAIIGEAQNTIESAQSLAALSEETNASVEEVKSAVEQVAAMSEANSAALEETNAGVQEVSTSATNSAKASTDGASASGKTIEVARGAVNQVNTVIDDIEVVGGKSKDVETTINELAKAVNAISGFVTTITGIADQTNLLALNAAIEAARAGDAGRGFAVVADEVRKLAEESGKAANEVGTLISSLQSGAQQALSVTNESGNIMEKTVREAKEAQEQLTGGLNEVAKISDIMQNIAAGAQEQAAAAEQMAAGVDQVSTATVQVVEAVANIRSNSDETAKASEGVAEHAQALTEGAERMQKHLARFKVDEAVASTETAKAPA